MNPADAPRIETSHAVLKTRESHCLLEVRSLTAGYPQQPVLRDVTFTVASGDTLVVLGESGCGKTTLLKALAGLIPIAAGEIRLDSRPIQDVPPGRREIVYLDQEPLLFEHLSIAENIGFALKLRQRPTAEIEREVGEMLAAIDLREHAQKRHWQLSGGQKQRVAFARAILARPRLLLLDEPFCSLDGGSRAQMQSLYAELSQRFGLTSIFVTHDVKEALVVGNRFVRMSGGALFLYPDRQTLINDRATGIPAEIAFWRESAELLDERMPN